MQNSNNLSKNDPIMFNIICRSLFILKSKFEIYKNDINKLYTKYFVKDKNNYNNNTFKIIKKESFKNLLEEICNLINISIFKITSMNELFMSNFIPEIRNEERQNKAIEKINNYITDKIRKYNQIYFTRKIKPLIEINKIEEISDDFTNYYPIGEYDKNGNLINVFEQIKILNKENYIKSKDLTLEEEYELNIKEDNILYIETLPMIIADFINLHSSYVIINTEINDSKLNNDIKNLFDGEIMKRIEKEYSNLTERIVNLPQTFEDEMKVKNILERHNEINKKIKIYENLLKQKKKSGENIIFLKEFVNQLKEEKEKFNKNISKEQKELIKRNKINEKLKIIKNNNKENILNNDNIITITKTEETIENNLSTENLSEETEDNLYEIFLFYANQQNEKLLSPTFDEMAYRKVRLNFDEFSKFLIDFEVKIQKEKLIELFNKNSTNKLMSFEQFKNIFLKMGLPMNNYRKEKLFKKIKLYDVKLKLEKNKKNESIQNKLNELKMNENTIEEEYKRLNNLDYKGVKEEFDDYIGINQPNIYREKMKGFLDLKEREIDFENKLIFKKPHLINISNKFKLKKNSHKKLLIDKEKKLEEFKNNNNNIIENNENEIYNQKDKIKENKFFYVSKKEKEELIKKEEEKQKLILLKKKLEEEELEKKRKLEEEERQRKKALLEEEKRKYIFSFPRIEKSSLKDIEIDEKDEKLLLIDSESENSDIEILNRFGNLNKKNTSQIIEKENDNKIENKIENNNNINNELENNKNNYNNNDNKNINDNNSDNNDNKNINNKLENNDNNCDNNDKNINNKLENNDNNNNKLENKNNTSNNNNIYEKELINSNRNETPKTIDNNKIKKIIIKSPSNPLYTRNNDIYYKNNVYSPNKYISNNINQSSKTERTKPLIKAGEKIISSNYDSFNEQITHFYKPINKKINKEEKINKSTFLKKSIQKIKNNIK